MVTDRDNELTLSAFTSTRTAEDKHNIWMFTHNSCTMKSL